MAVKHKLFIFMLIVVFVLGWLLHWSSIEKGDPSAAEQLLPLVTTSCVE